LHYYFPGGKEELVAAGRPRVFTLSSGTARHHNNRCYCPRLVGSTPAKVRKSIM
jgi:hypothetical protein